MLKKWEKDLSVNEIVHNQALHEIEWKTQSKYQNRK